jgi:hypothetical protein
VLLFAQHSDEVYNHALSSGEGAKFNSESVFQRKEIA